MNDRKIHRADAAFSYFPVIDFPVPPLDCGSAELRLPWSANLSAKVIGRFAAIVLAASPCAADDATGRTRGREDAAHSSLALLDVQHLLDRHPALERRQQEIEAGAALAEATIAVQRREIGRLTERLAALRAGSPEHAELDLKLIRQKAELRAQIARAREKLSAERARAHAAAYREIVRAVEDYLQETGYRIVMRKSAGGSEPWDPVARSAASPFSLSDAKNLERSRAEILRSAQNDNAGDSPLMPSPLIFAQAGVDITQEILRRLQGGPRKAAGRTRKASPR
jgi:Skp family chaperone for outer membrane proteins